MNTFKILFAVLFFLGSTVVAQDNQNRADLDPFQTLYISGSAKIYLTQGDSYYLKGDADDLRKLDFTVRDGRMSIPGLNLKKVYLNVADLDKIVVEGSAKIISESVLKGDDIEIDINGSGNGNLHLDMTGEVEMNIAGTSNYILRGNANSLDVEVEGTANVDARNLSVVDAEVEISGVGKVLVDVSNELNAEISGAGKIFYVKEPAVVKKEISGLGKVSSVSSLDPDKVEITIGDKDLVIINNRGSITSDTISLFPKKVRPHWAGFELGFNGYVNSDFTTALPDAYSFLELNTEKSVAVNINFFDKGFNLYRRNIMAVTGLGLSYNNYHFRKDFTLVPDAPRVMSANPLPPYTDTINYSKSKLVASYVTVPLLLQFNTSEVARKSVSFTTGVVGGYRLGSHTKRVTKEGGKKDKDKDYDDFNLRPVKLDARFGVTYRSLNIFATYSLIPMFKDGEGPVLYPYSIGLRLLGW